MIINTKKSGGITPTGKKLITDTSETDVAEFATAQVSSDTLLAANIKKDVNILGVVGSFEGGGVQPLPSEYTEYEYIESSGTQFINLPTLWGGTTTKTKIRFVAYSANSCVFGTNGGDNECVLGLGVNHDRTYLMGVNSTYRINTAQDYNILFKLSNPQKIEIDGTTIASTSSTNIYAGATLKRISLFVASEGSTSSNTPFPVRIYSYEVYIGEALIYKLIPCMRNSDDVLGLFDLINQNFYTNAGTGEFIGGALT